MPTKTRHVALFLRSLAGVGPVRVLLDLARELAQRELRVDVVVAYGSGAYQDRVPPGVRLVDLKAGIAQACLPRLLGNRELLRALGPIPWLPGSPRVLGAIPALADYLHHQRPDVLLAAQHYGNLAAACAHAVAGSPGRLLLSQRTQLSVYLRAGRTPRKRFALNPIRRLYPRAEAVVCVSQGVADDLHSLTGLPADRLPVIYNPVVTEDLAHQAAKPAGHPWLDEPNGPPVVLAAGRLHQQKDFPTLLRAFAELRRQRPVRLVVLGEGRDRRALGALARQLGIDDHLDMPGFVTNPFAYMSRARLFVLSSHYEGLPGVLIQALACGCPVVSTDCPSGPSEILEQGRWGRLTPVRDSAALAAAMGDALDSPADREALAQRAQAFSMERSLERYLELLGCRAPAPAP